MQIVPAVDIRGGRCVNLVQGDYGRETVFSEDPVAQAVKWHALGGAIVHIVDLDGAKAGHLCVEKELAAMHKAGVPYDLGGGVRNMDTIHRAFELGAERIILGTAAHREPALVEEAAKAYPGKIVVGVDAKNGRVSLTGWTEDTETDAIEFSKQMQDRGAVRIIYTDILSDGMMQGPHLESTRAIAEAIDIPVTASGGISSLDDVRNVCGLADAGVDEMIIGRALYFEKFTLPEAIDLAQAPA